MAGDSSQSVRLGGAVPEPLELVAWPTGGSVVGRQPTTSWAISTPLGWIGWTMTPTGLRQLRFGYGTLSELAGQPAPASVGEAMGQERPDRWSVELADRLGRYVAGERVEFHDIPCDLDGWPDFGRRVLAECRSIPWGEVWTYGQLARQAGAPRAARAVGAALGRNPMPLVIPCHRIVGSTGRLVGFSAPGGVATKCRLLELEGHHPAADRLPLDTSRHLPVGRQP